MTRASAANGDVCPVGPIRGLSGEGGLPFAQAWARRPAEGLGRSRLRAPGVARRRGRIPSAVFISVAFAIFGVVALTVQHLRLERDLALSAGAHEVDMRATLHRPEARCGAER